MTAAVLDAYRAPVAGEAYRFPGTRARWLRITTVAIGSAAVLRALDSTLSPVVAIAAYSVTFLIGIVAYAFWAAYEWIELAVSRDGVMVTPRVGTRSRRPHFLAFASMERIELTPRGVEATMRDGVSQLIGPLPLLDPVIAMALVARLAPEAGDRATQVRY